VDRPICGGVHHGMVGMECGMYVKGQVGTQEVEMFIDSGANISLIGSHVYTRMKLVDQPLLQEHEVPMVTADGTPMEVQGCAEFKFQVGEDTQLYEHQMCVAEVGVDVILGYDFLKKYEAIIDLGKDQIDLKVHEGAEAPTQEGVEQCNVVIGRTLVVPAGGEAIAMGRCVGRPNDFVGMIEVNERFAKKHCMLIARAVVNVGKKEVPVRMFNLEDHPVTIYRNTMVAKCMMVEVVETEEEKVEKESGESGGRVPGHLKNLYDTGCEELEDNDKEKLAKLLIEYEEVFSAHSLDMGKTGRIKHAIDTQNAHPIKQKLRRVHQCI
jgi:dUTPase